MKKLKLFMAAFALLLGWSNAWAQSWTASEVGAGTFYLYNVGAEKFLCSGNNWGSHASVTEGGIPVTLAGSGTTYTISSASIYSGKYLGSNGYMDNGSSANWEFIAVDGQPNTYKLKQGDNYLSWNGTSTNTTLGDDPGTNAAYWKLATESNRIADMDNATALSPMDVTFLIKNAYFAKGEGRIVAKGADLSSSPSWKGTILTDLWGKDEDSENACYCVEQWNKTFDNYQEISGIPNGKYILKAKGFYRGSEVPYIYANSVKGNFKAKGDIGGDNITNGAIALKGDTYLLDDVTVIVTDGSLRVGAKSDNNIDWCCFDDFRLTYYGVDLSGLKEAYETALAEAQAAHDNATYANVTGSELTDLETALTTYATCEESQTAYETATTALNNAKNAFVAAKDSYDGLAAARTEGATYTTVAWPRASSAKKTALDNAVAAAAPTSAADAVTKTNAIVTAYRQFVESNGLAEGVATAVNKTSSLLVYDASVSTSGWTSGSIGTNTNEPYTTGTGTAASIYFDGGWSASAGVSITLTQELTLPAGQYQLQITARGATNLTSYTMSVGASSVDLPHVGASGGTFGRGWSDKYLTFTSDGSAVTLTIAAASTEYYQWISFNRLRLVRLDTTLATAEDYEALNDAIAATEANLGFQSGENAPYNNVEAMNLLVAAKAIDQEVNNAQEDVQDATNALNGASWTANTEDVNAIFNGMFDSDVKGDWGLTGWTRTNGWGQQRTEIEGAYTTAYYNQPGSLKYGNTGVYIMPLAANKIYKLTFSYRSHENGSNQGVTASVLKGEQGLTATSFGANGSTSNWKTVSAYFVTDALGGNYVLTLANSGNTWMTNVSLVKVDALEFADGSVPTYAPGTYPSVKITRTLTADSWATGVYPFAISGVDGLTTVNMSAFEGDVLTFSEGATVANQPFLMKASSTKSEISLTNVAVAATSGEANQTISNITMKGVYSTGTVPVSEESTYRYIVDSSNNTLRKVVDGGTGVNINPYRAYFELSGIDVNNARSNIRMNFGGITGVENIEAAPVAKAKKNGAYLENGKIAIYKNGEKFSATGAKLK